MENATTIRSRLRDEVYQIVENEFRTTMPNSNTELPEFNKWRKDKIYRTLALLSNFLANNKSVMDSSAKNYLNKEIRGIQSNVNNHEIGG